MRKTTKTKAAAALLTLAMALLLTACGHEHTWQDATCTEPQTCSECGKTEGEALGHSWKEATCSAPKACSLCGETEGEALPHTWEEATCSAPKTCTVCGETEGEALPHTLTEANFQTPATCTVCGATEGDVLTPEFEKYSVELTPHEGTHDLMFKSSDDGSTLVNKISLVDYQVFESDETHPAKEGYEYRTAVIDLLVREDSYRFYFAYGGCDYYSKTTITNNESGEEPDYTSNISGTVSIYGEEYDHWNEMTFEYGEWEKDPETDEWISHSTFNIIAQVPVGYDGIVACVYDGLIVTDDVKNSEGEYFPAEVFSKNPGHYVAFRLD